MFELTCLFYFFLALNLMSISLENKSLMKENVPPDRTKRKTKEKQECLVKHANILNVIILDQKNSLLI